MLDEDSITSLRTEVHNKEPLFTGSFGSVFKSSWNAQTVLLRVYRTRQLKISSDESSNIHKILEALQKLTHPRLLHVMGAQATDNDVTIVVPFLKNGGIIDFLWDNPGHNRIQTLYDISEGIRYLHKENLVHGDIKGSNILIDDEKHGVLCDAGMFSIKTGLSDVPAQDFAKRIELSRDWMAPERLADGSVQKSGDIYSFAMTAIEIFIGEDPLNSLLDSEFIEQVVDRSFRPERPDMLDHPSFSDALWDLMQQCWKKLPESRPTATQVSSILAGIAGLPIPESPLPSSNTVTVDFMDIDDDQWDGFATDVLETPILVPETVPTEEIFAPNASMAPAPNHGIGLLGVSTGADTLDDLWFADEIEVQPDSALVTSIPPVVQDEVQTELLDADGVISQSKSDNQESSTPLEATALVSEDKANTRTPHLEPYPMPLASGDVLSSEATGPQDDGFDHTGKRPPAQPPLEPRRRLGTRLFIPPVSLASAPSQPRNPKLAV